MDCKHPFRDYFHLPFHAIKQKLMFLLGYCEVLSSEKCFTFLFSVMLKLNTIVAETVWKSGVGADLVCVEVINGEMEQNYENH